MNIWHRDGSIASVEEGGTDYHARLNFLRHVNDEAITAHMPIAGKMHLYELADKVRELLDLRSPLTGIHTPIIFVTGEVMGHKVLVEVHRKRGDEDSFDEWSSPNDFLITNKSIKLFSIYVTGHREAIRHIFISLNELIKNDKYAIIKWWYRNEHGVNSTSTYLDPIKTKLLPEFYPDLPVTPHEFLKNYLDSQSSVLLMAGDPGTGKTTMLRHLICDFNLTAHVVYDETLLTSDQVFQSFLFGPDDILVVEDADVILSPRDGGDNKLMARFLNISDGLIKLPNKKIVFTTNINDFGRVDQALLRPGRCFGVLHTRAFNLGEAQAAARAADLPVPTERGEYTLAQLFNRGQGGFGRRVGFSAQ